MIKRKEFMLGAVAGLTIAAAATAGGVIDWPTATAEPIAGVSGRLTAKPGAAPNFAPPQGAPLSFADIFQQVAPAVVQIDVEARVQGGQRGGFIQIPGLGAVPIPGAPPSEGEEGADGEGATTMGAGSGFFISGDGYIVTNNHVVADAVGITVKLADGRELEGSVVGRDADTDLAVIKVEGRDFPFVSFEESAQPRVGDWVIAVGNPFGLGGTATAGIVSAQGRNQLDSRTPYTDYLQIDAAINRGNSGGPTFDIYGRVIGVNSAIISPGFSGGSVGIGFAIPASVAKPITERLMRGETIERGYLGVTIGTPTDEQLAALGLPESTKGAIVSEVVPDGPAAAAGLGFSDIVTAMNGEAITTSSELTRRVADVRPGERIRLDILRDGRRQTVTVRSGSRPSVLPGDGAPTPDPSRTPRESEEASGQVIAGLNVAAISPPRRSRYSIPAAIEGVVVTGVASGGDRRFQPGFVIQQVGSTPLRSIEDFRTAVATARSAGRNSLLLKVWTGAEGSGPVVFELPQPE